MNLKLKKQKPAKACSVQTARSKVQPFSALSSYTPLATHEQDLYDTLREAIPIIDGAIDRIVRLIGTFKVDCGNAYLNKKMQNFLDTVKVGSCSEGINTFINIYFDRLLTLGTAVCEIVPDNFGEIAAIYPANNKAIELKKGENPLDGCCKRCCCRLRPPY